MKYFLILTLFFSNLAFGEKYELAICAIFHNEGRFLKDWIDFHSKMGVEHFYLYNHLSDDDYATVLEPYINSGIVELTDWNYTYEVVGEWNKIQCAAYNDGLAKAKNDAKWLAVIDIDEYLYSPKKKLLTQILKDFHTCGAVCVNWVMYGTSHLYEIDPTIPLILQLTHRIDLESDVNLHVKCIVRPLRTFEFKNPHYPILCEEYQQVTEKKEAFTGPFSPSLSVKKLRINHYWTRDEKFLYLEKLPRLKSWWENVDEKFEHLNEFEDFEICEVYKKITKLKK